MKMFNKKGALQLSINAIVVLILAITVLGLALTFITNMFGSATGNLKTMNEEQEKRIIDEMASSNKLLTFKNMELNLKSGDEKEFAMGIRNTDPNDKYTFYTQFVCLTTRSNYTSCPVDTYAEHTNAWTWFNTWKNIPIESREGRAVFIKVNAQGTPNVYRGKIVVWKCLAGAQNCPEELCYHKNATKPTNLYQGGNCGTPLSDVTISEHGSEQINVVLT
jgi:hypothetical protein